MAQAEEKEVYEPEEVEELPDWKRKELEERVRDGETVVRGGTGGRTLEAQIHLAKGRRKGGERRKEELGGPEGYKELRRRTASSRMEDETGHECVEDKEVYTLEEVKRLPEWKKKELDERARAGLTVVEGGTNGKSLEAQIRLAEGRRRGGEHRAEELGHEGYQELGRKGGQSLAHGGPNPLEEFPPW